MGLVNMKGRSYDPGVGRFISPDPFVWDPFSAQALNRYAYVMNNPATLVDPTGFQGAGVYFFESDESTIGVGVLVVGRPIMPVAQPGPDSMDWQMDASLTGEWILPQSPLVHGAVDGLFAGLRGALEWTGETVESARQTIAESIESAIPKLPVLRPHIGVQTPESVRVEEALRRGVPDALATAGLEIAAIVIPLGRGVEAPRAGTRINLLGRTASRNAAGGASSFGARSLGAAEVRVLQTGGNRITGGTAKALNEFSETSLSRREWGRALERLTQDWGLPNNHHGKITSRGDYLDQAGEFIGNLLEYLP